MVNTDPCNSGAEPSGSGPFWAGTGIFVAFTFLFCFINFMLGTTGRFNKQTISMSYVLLPTAVFCMWIMWAMVWLSQWHPLICPTMSHEEH